MLPVLWARQPSIVRSRRSWRGQARFARFFGAHRISVSSYIKLGAVDSVERCRRWVQIRSEMRPLSMRRASFLLLPRA